MIKKISLSHSSLMLVIFVIGFFVAGCLPQSEPPTALPTTGLPTQTQTPSLEDTPIAPIMPTEAVESLSCLSDSMAVAPSARNHIGLQTPPELSGFRTLDVLLIQSGDKYSIGLDRVLEGQDQYLFWLERFCRNKNGQRFTEVIDEIILPPLKEDEFATPTCEIANEEGSYAVATGYFRKEVISGLTYKKVKVTRAWLIDLDKWVFVEIPTEQFGSVSCSYEYQ